MIKDKIPLKIRPNKHSRMKISGNNRSNQAQARNHNLINKLNSINPLARKNPNIGKNILKDKS